MWHHDPLACADLDILLSHKSSGSSGNLVEALAVSKQTAAILLLPFPVNKSPQRQMTENEII